MKFKMIFKLSKKGVKRNRKLNIIIYVIEGILLKIGWYKL